MICLQFDGIIFVGMNPLELTKGDGLEPENDAGDPKEVDQEVEEACLSDVFEAPIIGTSHCNRFTS